MSAKKLDNDSPFAALKAAHFPSERSEAKGQQSKKRPVKPAQSADKLALSTEEPDAALFFQAVSSSTRLVPKEEPSHKKGQSKLKPPAGPVLPASSASADDESALAEVFRQTFASRQADSKSEAAPEPAPATKLTPQNPQHDALGLANPDIDSNDFFQALKDVKPLSGKGRVVTPEPPAPVPLRVSVSNSLQDLVDGKIEFAISGSEEFVEGHVVGLDLLTVGRLQARHYSPEAHIDLHGLNSEQAYQNLVGFFRSAYHKGVRTVLIVTGRGLNSPNGTPILRPKIQDWFVKEPFRRVVLAFCTAKQEDGGTGALYVLLRKYRKNAGKISWDIQPTDPDFFL